MRRTTALVVLAFLVGACGDTADPGAGSAGTSLTGSTASPATTRLADSTPTRTEPPVTTTTFVGAAENTLPPGGSTTTMAAPPMGTSPIGTMIAVGVPEPVAFPAALTHRMVTAYLPPVFGWWASRWLTDRDYL